MIASLPMYDTAATQAANDRFWCEIRDAYGAGPSALNRTETGQAAWVRDDLVFSQTCGLPYRAGLHEQVQLIGTPDYGLAGCPPGYYKSAIIVRKNDPRHTLPAFQSARIARNDPTSHSGWAALLQDFKDADAGISCDAPVLTTGSHAASAQAVAGGHADLAAIDAVTWAFMIRDTAHTRTLRVLKHTAPTPGLPYITGSQQDATRLFQAVSQAMAALGTRDRACLMLRGLVPIPAEVYLNVPMP